MKTIQYEDASKRFASSRREKAVNWLNREFERNATAKRWGLLTLSAIVLIYVLARLIWGW